MADRDQGPAVVLSREERIRRFGVDCGDGLEWRSWTPGGEYTKKLVVHNVSKQIIRIKYKLPATRYFNMDFPQVLKLSPGVSCTVPVTFRPIRLERYDDFVEFVGSTGSFLVPVRALLPKIALETPPSVDFGFCPVREITERAFQIRNTGELRVRFAFEVNAPFSISPVRGSIGPGAVATITARFLPIDGSSFVASSVCRIDDEQSQVISFVGVGKYPHLTVSEDELDFGTVLTGSTVERPLRLHNQSLVAASYSVQIAEQDHDGVFAFRPSKGIVPAGGLHDVRVVFRPISTGTFHSDHFNITTPGVAPLRITCRGVAEGPSVTASSNTLTFGSVEVGTTVSRVVTLHNYSDGLVHYQFSPLPHNGVFEIHQPFGVIPARLEVHVQVTFAPLHPINFHKRLFCLIRDQLPLVFDLIGTAYDGHKRPAPLAPRHIEAFRVRQTAGLSRLPPEELEVVLNEESINQVQHEALPSVRKTILDFFLEPKDKSREICVDTNELNLGTGSRFRAASCKTVTIENRTQGKVLCVWVGGSKDAAPTGRPPIFSVLPSEAEIGRGGRGIFRFGFLPPQDGQYYTDYMECYVYYKAMRTFRLVSELTITPPWCLVVRAHGHSFPANSEQFVPSASFDRKCVHFPPCHVRGCAYQTVELTNTGDIPVHWAVEQDPTETFLCKPTGGVIAKGGFQLLMLRFCPREPRRYVKTLICALNNNPTASLEMMMVGTGCIPRLVLGGGGSLFFRPTTVGTVSSSELLIKNPSRIPIRFQWDIPLDLASLYSVEPVAETLQGNEVRKLRWTFAPDRPCVFNHSVTCTVLEGDEEEGDGGDGGGTSLPLKSASSRASGERLSLSLSGQGALSSVRLSPEVLDFGTVLVGTAASRELCIINEGDGDVEVMMEVNDECVDPSTLDRTRALRLEIGEGVVQARTTMRVATTFCPHKGSTFNFRVSCFVAMGSRGLKSAQPFTQFEGFQIPSSLSVSAVGSGAYPTLCITDARSLQGVSTLQIWRQLHLQELNEGLLKPPTTDELNFSPLLEVEGTGERRVELESFVLDMGCGGIGDAATVFYVNFSNVSLLSLTWDLKYQSECGADLDLWMHTQALGEEKEETRRHSERGPFHISPRHGRLEHGQSMCVQIAYHHSERASHEVSTVLQIEKGRAIKLWLRGQTLGSSEPFTPFFSGVHTFVPTPIGQWMACIQEYILRNLSGIAAPYTIGTAPLTKLCASSGFEVLSCRNPKGIVPPKGRVSITFLFHPLEARTYQVVLPIRMGKEAHPMTLVGLGYNPLCEAPQVMHEDEGVPMNQILQTPDLPLSLSRDIIDFAEIPCFALEENTVVLMNTSDVEVEFSWEQDHPLLTSGALRVFPSSGRIPVGHQTIIKITLHAGASPRVIVDELRCLAVPISEESDSLTTTAEVVATSPQTTAVSERSAGFVSSTMPARRSVISSLPKYNVSDRGQQRYRNEQQGHVESHRMIAPTSKPTADTPKDQSRPEALLVLCIRATVLSQEHMRIVGFSPARFYCPHGVLVQRPLSDCGVAGFPRILANELFILLLQDCLKDDSVKHLIERRSIEDSRKPPFFVQWASKHLAGEAKLSILKDLQSEFEVQQRPDPGGRTEEQRETLDTAMRCFAFQDVAHSVVLSMLFEVICDQL